MTTPVNAARLAPPPEVAEALRVLDLQPASVTALSGDVPWSPRPRVFRIETADARQLKVRLCTSTRWAARSTLLVKRLADPHIVAPLGRVGRITVEPWVDGAPLSALSLTDQHLDAAARLLGRVHRFPGTAGGRLPQVRTLGPLRARVHRCLHELSTAKVINRTDSVRLATIVERGLPASAPWGLIHGDLCGANLVVAPGGDLVSIDNEHFRRGFLEFDLARAWYRWRLPAEAELAFARHYRQSVRGESAERVRAWRAVAAILGVHMRYTRGVPLDWSLAAIPAVVNGHRRRPEPSPLWLAPRMATARYRSL